MYQVADAGRFPAVFSLPTAPDDGIVVDMAEHFEEVVSVRIADLAQSVDARFEQVDARFDAVDVRFEQVDARFDAVDARLDKVDSRFDEVSEHFVEMRDFTTFCFEKLQGEMIQGHERLQAEISGVKAGLGRVERRLDRHEELLGEVLTEVRALKPK
jgi:predicted nuclease with TOPRIM domain